MKVQDALARYLVQLEADGRSIHTRSQYQRHVKLLASWLGDTDVERVDHETLAVFLATPVARLRPDGKEKKPVAMNTLRTSLRCFFAYLHAAGEIRSNPARLIRRAICGGPPPRSLSPPPRLLSPPPRSLSPPPPRSLWAVPASAWPIGW